jgi:hypothetical protein
MLRTEPTKALVHLVALGGLASTMGMTSSGRGLEASGFGKGVAGVEALVAGPDKCGGACRAGMTVMSCQVITMLGGEDGMKQHITAQLFI